MKKEINKVARVSKRGLQAISIAGAIYVACQAIAPDLAKEVAAIAGGLYVAILGVIKITPSTADDKFVEGIVEALKKKKIVK